MKDRKTFIAGMFDSNPKISQLEVNRKVKAKFGKGVSFVHIKALRAAWAKGKYSSEFDQLFSEKTGTASKPKARKAKERGERRKQYDIRGRRTKDRSKVAISELKHHLVVYREQDGFMTSEEYKSRKHAENRVKSLVRAGLSATDIGYFKRTEVQAKVTL